jgi:hypothetical protein
MRKFASVVLLLAVSMPLLYGQKSRVGQGPPFAKPKVDYPLKVHITGIRIHLSYCTGFSGNPECNDEVHVNMNVNGKIIECSGDPVYSTHRYEFRILPGDYQARLVKSGPSKDDMPVYQVYELLLPERRAWQCIVTGFSE